MSAQHRGAAWAGLCPSYFGFGSTAAWGLFAEADQVQAIFKRHRKRDNPQKGSPVMVMAVVKQQFAAGEQ